MAPRGMYVCMDARRRKKVQVVRCAITDRRLLQGEEQPRPMERKTCQNDKLKAQPIYTHLCQLLLVLRHESGIYLDLSGRESGSSNEFE